MWTTVFDMLPDISGILLAALGVALVVAPEMVSKLPTWIRWTLAALLIVVGIAGLRSSYVQRQESDQKQSDLMGSINDLKIYGKNLKETVDVFGPKLDAIINHPNSPEQKALAIKLRDELKPRIQVDEPSLESVTPVFSMRAEMTNIGGSVAKGLVDTSDAFIAVRSKASESELFSYLNEHEHDSDRKPMDMNPGYGGRAGTTIASRPAITPYALLHMKANEVVYIGILVTYSDEEGRRYHTEKCLWFDNVPSHFSQFCEGHNISY
ncbi:MAG: DUF308 domain-containing protein [Terracidiphilus sp.]